MNVLSQQYQCCPDRGRCCAQGLTCNPDADGETCLLPKGRLWWWTAARPCSSQDGRTKNSAGRNQVEVENLKQNLTLNRANTHIIHLYTQQLAEWRVRKDSSVHILLFLLAFLIRRINKSWCMCTCFCYCWGDNSHAWIFLVLQKSCFVRFCLNIVQLSFQS